MSHVDRSDLYCHCCVVRDGTLVVEVSCLRPYFCPVSDGEPGGIQEKNNCHRLSLGLPTVIGELQQASTVTSILPSISTERGVNDPHRPFFEGFLWLSIQPKVFSWFQSGSTPRLVAFNNYYMLPVNYLVIFDHTWQKYLQRTLQLLHKRFLNFKCLHLGRPDYHQYRSDKKLPFRKTNLFF